MTEIEVLEASESLTRIAVRGRLDAQGVGAVELKLTAQTIARRRPAVVDLTAVDVLPSIGIGMLVAIGRSMRGHGLGFAVVATGIVKDILTKAKIDTIFPVVETHEDADRAVGLG